MQQADDLHEHEAVDALVGEQLSYLVEVALHVERLPELLLKQTEELRHLRSHPVPADGDWLELDTQVGVRLLQVV